MKIDGKQGVGDDENGNQPDQQAIAQFSKIFLSLLPGKSGIEESGGGFGGCLIRPLVGF
jgi:hypothetical protein